MPSPHAFEPASYGSIVGRLLEDLPIPPLSAGRPNAKVRGSLESLTPAGLVPDRSPVDSEMAAACCAGLWLVHNYLTESHKISQSIDTPTGSFWHGIMHRREGDYSNAKYWFRRVGQHPVFEPLGVVARQIATDKALETGLGVFAEDSPWDPFAWIDLCERVPKKDAASAKLCGEIQQAEWALLFDFCFRVAYSE